MPGDIDHGDTAWMLAAAALVMFMTPGLGFFYAGFTRSKNALATIMMLLSLVSITVAVLILRAFNKRQGTGRSAVEDFARFEI